MKHLVVLTGAGISAESGINTFRGQGGLWGTYDPDKVSSIEVWHRDKALVLDFFNQRKKEMLQAQPNEAHRILAELEKDFKVSIITQNIDNLHEKAGSTNVLHLHGEITKVCSEDKSFVIDIGDKEIRQRQAKEWLFSKCFYLRGKPYRFTTTNMRKKPTKYFWLAIAPLTSTLQILIFGYKNRNDWGNCSVMMRS